MVILTQPPCYMRLFMLTTKWQFWLLVHITIHFHIFVCKIIIILNMIFYVCTFSFPGSLSVFSLINDSMVPLLFKKIFCYYLAILTFFGGVQECIRIYESNNFDPGC